MRFLLDTNVCVDYLTGRFPNVIARLQGERPEDVVISVIAVAELRYGADKSSKVEDNHARLDRFLTDVGTLPFDVPAARAYGRLRTTLERSGSPIGPNDMLIAAQALAHDLVVVTANQSEFERVEGLRVTSWRG
jgi:tRNA(fMet)-specific endonuclease VapC